MHCLRKVYQGDDTTTCYLDQIYDSYDAANRVGRTIASGDTFDLSYWDTGTPKEVQYPNGAKEVYGLNVRGQLDSIATNLGDTLLWFKHKYGYNGLGDRTWQYVYQTRPGVSTLSDTFKYGYDGLRRLTTAIYPPSTNSGDTITYVYDAVGNRLEKQSVVSGTTTYSIDNSTNRMTQAGNYYFDYDSCGNWTRKWHTTDEGSVVDIYFSYDYENRLTDARGPGYDPYYMTNTYNGDGVRLSKATNADAEKRYAYDGMNTVVEQDASSYLRYKYVYVNGMLLSKIDASDSKEYYHRDGLGSIIGVSTSTPEILTAQLFDEFGNWLYFDSDWDYYGYTGQEYDWTLMDAVNLRAREYYPEYGRFMQQDPIGDAGGSLNWYLYVRNNPINWSDITGQYIQIIIWQPVGHGQSSFGHVSTNINGTSYSLAHSKMDIRPMNEYISINTKFRDGVGMSLNLSECEEKIFTNCMKNWNTPYNALSNNCVQPPLNCLIEAGRSMPVIVLPVAFGNYLMNSGWVTGYNFYNKQ